MTRILALAGLVLLPALPGSAEPPAILETKVVNSTPGRGLVALAAGRHAGVVVGDRFFLAGDAVLPAGGRVFLVTDKACTGRLAGSQHTVRPGQLAAVLREAALSSLRDRLPPGTTIAGSIARLPPGRRTAWIDLGSSSGLKLGDELLVWRRAIPTPRGPIDIPIARASVAQLEAHVALVALQPLVSNALPEPGDAVELWPAPADRRWGQATSAVLQVQPGKEGAEITMVGALVGGTVEGWLADVFRDGKYVGVAEITEATGPLTRARMIASMSAQAPEEGDRVVERPRAASRPYPLAAAIFRIEGEHCLLAAGETDGIEPDETFVVHRPDPGETTRRIAVAELRVEKAQVTYADARIRPLIRDAPAVQLWELAERQVPDAEVWQPIGIVEQAEPALCSAAGSVEPASRIAPGALVRLVPENRTPAAAIVIGQVGDRVVTYIPPGWGDLSHLPRARIEALLPPPTSTRAAPTPASAPAATRPARNR